MALSGCHLKFLQECSHFRDEIILIHTFCQTLLSHWISPTIVSWRSSHFVRCEDSICLEELLIAYRQLMLCVYISFPRAKAHRIRRIEPAKCTSYVGVFARSARQDRKGVETSSCLANPWKTDTWNMNSTAHLHKPNPQYRNDHQCRLKRLPQKTILILLMCDRRKILSSV